MKIRLPFYLLLVYLVTGEVKAQEPVTSTGKFAMVNGLKIYYEDTGKGMPLILLHGFGRTSSDWQSFIPEFSKSYRVIAIDMPGHGRSDFMDTSDVYLHKRAAEFVLGLMDSLHIDSANVLGTSSGAFVTLYMATLKPQLTKRIMVIAGQVYYSKKTRNVIASLGGPENRIMNQESIYKLHGKQKGILISRQFWNFRQLYGDPSFTPDVLSTIKARTLIIHGDNDPIAPVSNAWEMYQHIPMANLWIIPNGGHVPTAIPANKDDFMRRVQEFMRGDWERR